MDVIHRQSFKFGDLRLELERVVTIVLRVRREEVYIRGGIIDLFPWAANSLSHYLIKLAAYELRS